MYENESGEFLKPDPIPGKKTKSRSKKNSDIEYLYNVLVRVLAVRPNPEGNQDVVVEQTQLTFKLRHDNAATT